MPVRFSVTALYRVLFRPRAVFEAVAAADPPASRVFFGFAIWIGLLPPLFAYVGTTRFGWRLGVEPVFLAHSTVLAICAAYFVALLFGFISSAVIARWMATTCDANRSLGRSMALMAIVGSPALNDTAWTYGGGRADVMASITNGRTGQMPAFGARLDDTQIRLLAAWLQAGAEFP